MILFKLDIFFENEYPADREFSSASSASRGRVFAEIWMTSQLIICTEVESNNFLFKDCLETRHKSWTNNFLPFISINQLRKWNVQVVHSRVWSKPCFRLNPVKFQLFSRRLLNDTFPIKVNFDMFWLKEQLLITCYKRNCGHVELVQSRRGVFFFFYESCFFCTKYLEFQL